MNVRGKIEALDRLAAPGSGATGPEAANARRAADRLRRRHGIAGGRGGRSPGSGRSRTAPPSRRRVRVRFVVPSDAAVPPTELDPAIAEAFEKAWRNPGEKFEAPWPPRRREER